MYSVMWSEHCSYKSSRRPPAAAARPRRRGCSSARARTPAWSTSATASPPPSASRATTTRRPSSPTRARPPGVGGILRDIFTMGARPIALMDPLRFGPLDDARSRWIAEGVVSRHLRLRQLGRRARPSAARSCSTRPTRATRWSTCCASGCCPPTAWCSARPRAWATWPCCSAPRTGRDGIGGVSRAGLGRLRRRRGRRRQATERAGRRPVRGEAADRGLPRAARRRPRRRHPGPRRRRPDLRHQRDGQPRRHGHGRRRLRRAPPRAGHGAVRGHDLREPGADAGHRRARATSTRCWRSASAGRCGPRWSGRVTDGRRAAHPRRPTATVAGRRAGRRRCTRPRRSTTGRCGARDRSRRAAIQPSLPRPDDAAPTCSAMLADTGVGLAASTTTSSSSTPSSGPAATPPCCA